MRANAARPDIIAAMGMCATVICVGPAAPELINFLARKQGCYASARPGTTVAVELFEHLFLGNNISRDFATCLGITDPLDVHQHVLSRARVDFPALRQYLTTLEYGEDYFVEVDAMQRMLDLGWLLIFMPNG